MQIFRKLLSSTIFVFLFLIFLSFSQLVNAQSAAASLGTTNTSGSNNSSGSGGTTVTVDVTMVYCGGKACAGYDTSVTDLFNNWWVMITPRGYQDKSSFLTDCGKYATKMLNADFFSDSANLQKTFIGCYYDSTINNLRNVDAFTDKNNYYGNLYLATKAKVNVVLHKGSTVSELPADDDVKVNCLLKSSAPNFPGSMSVINYNAGLVDDQQIVTHSLGHSLCLWDEYDASSFTLVKSGDVEKYEALGIDTINCKSSATSFGSGITGVKGCNLPQYYRSSACNIMYYACSDSAKSQEKFSSYQKSVLTKAFNYLTSFSGAVFHSNVVINQNGATDSTPISTGDATTGGTNNGGSTNSGGSANGAAGMKCTITGGTTQNPWVTCKDASGNDVQNEYYNHKNITDTQQSPLPAIGKLSWGYYDSTWNYRHTTEKYPDCTECKDPTTGYTRFIALMRGATDTIKPDGTRVYSGDKARKVCVLRDGQTSQEGPFYVIDVVKDTDKAFNINKNWIADVDNHTAEKWGMSGPIGAQLQECDTSHGGSGNNNGGGTGNTGGTSSSNSNSNSGSNSSATSSSNQGTDNPASGGNTSAAGRQFPIMNLVGSSQQNIAADFQYAWFTDGSLGYASGNDPSQAVVDSKIGNVIAKLNGQNGNKMFMVSDKDTLAKVMASHCEELYNAGVRYIGYDMEISPPGTEQEEMNARSNTDPATNSVAIAAKLSVGCHGMKLWWGSIFSNTVSINDTAMEVMMKAGLYGIAFQIQNQWDNPNGTATSQILAATTRFNADAAKAGVARPQYTEQVMTDGTNCLSQKGTVPMATCAGAVQGLIKAGLMDNLAVWSQGGNITETFLKQVLGGYYGTPSSGGGSSSSSSSSNGSNNTSSSSSAAGNNGAQLGTEIDTLLKNSGFSGGAYVTVDNNQIVNAGYSYANKAKQISNTATTLFRVESLTKTITATAVMKLVEEGGVSLDTKLCDAISCTGSTWSAITVRQLLNHASGIPDVESLVGSIETQEKSPAEVMALVANKALDFAPGTKQSYSSSNYILLGMVIEKKSGKSYTQYISDEFFTPLGLKNITVEENNCTSGSSNLSTIGYEGNNVASCIDMSIPFSAGDIISTASDFGKFVQKLFDGSIVSNTSLGQMTSSTLTSSQGRYGFGMWLDTYTPTNTPMYYHQGRINGFGSRFTILPKKGITIVLLSNVNKEQNTLTGQILEILKKYTSTGSSSSSSSNAAQVTRILPQVTPIINGKDQSALFGPNKPHTTYDIINGNCTCNGADTACVSSCGKGRYQLVISPVNLPAYGTIKSIDKDMIDLWLLTCNAVADSMMNTAPYNGMRSKINIVCVNDLSCNNLTGCTGTALDAFEIAGAYNASHQVQIDFGIGGYTTPKEDDVLGTDKNVTYIELQSMLKYGNAMINHLLGHGIGGLMHPGNYAPYVANAAKSGYTQDMFCEYRSNCESYYGAFYDGRACSTSVMAFKKDSSGKYYTNYCASEQTVLTDQINKSLR